MRWWLLLCGIFLLATATRAQEQEHKLADRLLRPDMSLSNPAQNRKFLAVEGTPVERKFVAREFYTGKTTSGKSFWGARSFLSKAFGTGKYARAEAAANAKANAEMAFAQTEFAARKSALARSSSAAEKTARVRDYADNRPFLAQGTRQKQLSRQNRPLTIEEVRELLNRN